MTTEDCCKEHPKVAPAGQVRIETERWGGVDSITIRLSASHPCGISAYSVSISADAGGGMRERFLREDVSGIDCEDNKDLEVIWRVGATGSGRATSNVKGKPTNESSFMTGRAASDFAGEALKAEFEVTSCCDTVATAEIDIAAVTFRPAVNERKRLAPRK